MTSLSYRNLCADDFPMMHEMASDWSIVRQLGSWPWPSEPEHTMSRCKPYGGAGFVWAILEGDRFCGSVAVTGDELGYALHPDAAGRGIMTRAANDAITHAFATTDLDQITASVWADNIGSQKVLGKLGFLPYRTAFERSFPRRMPVLCHYYRLRRDDWMS